MKLLTLIGLGLLLSGLSFVPLKSGENVQQPRKTEKDVMRCHMEDGEVNVRIIYDFGSKTVVKNKDCTFRAIYQGDDKLACLEAYEYDGDIGWSYKVNEDESCDVSLHLPNYDSSLTLVFVDVGGSKAFSTIYLSAGDNGLYGISTLSMMDAQYLVGNVEGQDCMDNDALESDDRGPTPEGDENTENGPRKVIASGRVNGYLKWTDVEGVVHPLAGAKVKITFTGSWGNASTYTNSSGYYDISFGNMWTAWAYEATIHVYAENDMIKVTNDSGNIYEKAQKLEGMSNGATYNYSYTFTKGSDMCKAMNIFTAGKNFSDHAAYLNGGTKISQCAIKFPCEQGADYSSNSIRLPQEKPGQNPTVHQSWDTIGHEYGHHLQNQFFKHDYYGSHSSGTSDIVGYFNDRKNSDSYDSDLAAAKKQGMGLAWSESWPTFFSIVAQKSFPDDLKTIEYVGDDTYTSRLGFEDDLNTINSNGSETTEITIMRFLFQLWDMEASAYDHISISEEDLWTVIISTKPEFFYGFINSLYGSGLSFSKSDLGLLLEGFNLSSKNVNITVSVQNNYAYIPKFTWSGSGFDITYNHNGTTKTYAFSNDMFALDFYDANKKFILSTSTTEDRAYTLSQSEWNAILLSSGSKYFAVVKAYDTLGMQSGPYYSRYYEFSKPSAASRSVSLADVRYYEDSLAIAPGTQWTYNLTFSTSGTKLIQTFGTADVKMSLYDSDGTTLIENDDDDGYGLNALIYRYFEKNKRYVLKISMFSSSGGGQTRLSISPIYGAQADGKTDMKCFENFVNINTYPTFTWGSYLATHYSKMVTWTVPEDGKYKISLSSAYDNYLYVVDPTSSDFNTYNVNCNDDTNGSNDRNASIQGTYSKGKTYAIYYCQYNPSNEIGASSVEDDITLKIEKQ